MLAIMLCWLNKTVVIRLGLVELKQRWDVAALAISVACEIHHGYAAKVNLGHVLETCLTQKECSPGLMEKSLT